MERRKVDILCVQETRWKGSKARSIGAGFKLFYYDVDSKRNGVGVVLKEEFVRNVLEVKRVSDRVMSLKLEIEGVMLNVVSGYAPQVGCELEEKERFWSELDEVMESIPTGERVVIGADFNGHVGEGNTGDEEVMGKFGVKERNFEGQMVVDFAKRMDMGVVNTYFQKREEHRVTYKSGGRRTQVVLPDDWETTAEVIRETGRKVLGVSSGRRKEDKETWWWNEEVQDSIQRKRLAKKKWDMDRTEENRQEYKELQRRVKREVSKAKQKAYDELYTRLDTREEEKDLYRLARQRDRDGKDVQQVRVIKDRDGRVLISEESVQRRWKEYFEELMNEENEREKRVEGVNSVEQKVDKIRKDEVRKALKRMKSGKAVGPDDIPVEVWKCLGEAAVEGSRKTWRGGERLQLVGPEEPLVAVAGEDLVLPCFIKPNTSAVGMTVEWFKLDVENSLVHLYRDSEDRNEGQAQSYRGRTSLFKEELQKGNASLKLSALRVSDEGKYKCLVEDKSWYDDITVNITVEAQGSHPVIMMESYDNSGGINLVCESRGWKPEPEVLWLDREGATLPAEDTQRH
ncbi:hypothetical protein QTP86_020430 [Hemibagrus guttatus]|nr:hypothetical protein QTP86_020430 [Hemibagrus guttatus]